MAKKGTKIKRYGSIYGRNSGSLAIAAAMVIGLGVFAVAGWLLYTPIHDFIMNIGQERVQQQGQAQSEPQQQSQSQPAESLPALEDTKEPAADSSEVRGIYIPAQLLDDGAALSSTLETAAMSGFNTVLIDAKDASGSVLYLSDNEIGKKTGVAAEKLYDASDAAQKIKSAGLTPAARLHAFRDAAAAISERELAVRYYDTQVYWFDNSPELGGKPWLNPYSEQAQQYIISLAEELCDSGFELIMLDSVQFPTGLALDKAGYGGAEKNVSRSQVLSQFVEKVNKAVEQKGAKLILCCSTDWLSADETMNSYIYGGSPTEYFTESVMITMPQGMENWRAVLESASNAGLNRPISLIPVFAADGTLVDSAELIQTLLSAGEKEYVFYNPHGSYKLK